MSCIIDDKINKLTLNETPILERDLIEDKMGILDVKASIDGEVSIDLEMQVAKWELSSKKYPKEELTKDIEINILELKKLEEQLKIEHIHSEKEKNY